ncbi:hypothetical protein AVEN_127784-1 [Araneus ventricosus]|uniref:Uncharacterized protein n=1 Tax=Araneus ventricosus TaxID=182803 RepID=A0A4Y2DRC7_ARAVE|nr:hypothetical protein AVEN_127784-1 [Araneus ventricosus]
MEGQGCTKKKVTVNRPWLATKGHSTLHLSPDIPFRMSIFKVGTPRCPITSFLYFLHPFVPQMPLLCPREDIKSRTNGVLTTNARVWVEGHDLQQSGCGFAFCSIRVSIVPIVQG